MERGQIQEAMAFRVKFRVCQLNPLRSIHVDSLGVHMMNRGMLEIYPNGSDVVSLCKEIVRNGFDASEANHNGIAVEEVPLQEHGAKDPVTGKTYRSIGDYNVEMSSNNSFLKTCFSLESARRVVAGTLSHSHLLLVLLCCRTCAKWDLVDEDGKPMHPCGEDGKINEAAIAARDAVFAELVNVGLRFELLSYKIYLEEPHACILISNALNKVNAAALKTTTLSALSSLTGAVGISASSHKLSGVVEFNSIKNKVRAEVDFLVDEPEFIEMFDFVVRLGADKNSYLPRFLKWTSAMVCSTKRQLRMASFTVLNKFKAGPLTNIALLERSLRQKPTSLQCPCPENALEKLTTEEFNDLEDVLFFFHTKCKHAVAALPSNEQSIFIANVDVAAANAFVGAALAQKLPAKKDMAIAVAKYWKQLQAGAEPVQDKVTGHWPSFRTAVDLAESAKAKPAVAGQKLPPTYAQPILIHYNEDTGKALRQADVRDDIKDEPEYVTLPWKEWIQSEASGKSPGTVRKMAELAALNVLYMAQLQSAADNDAAVAVYFKSDTKTKRVVALKDFLPNEITLLPPLPKTFKLRTESVHPERVAVQVISKWGASGQQEILDTTTFFLHPEWEAPKAQEVEDQNLAVASDRRAWEWTGKETMSPMWAVHRCTDAGLTQKNAAENKHGRTFNMEVQHKNYSLLGVGGQGISEGTCSWIVSVPFLANIAPVTKGDELLWRCLDAIKKTIDASKDWKHDHRIQEQQRKNRNSKKLRKRPQKRRKGTQMRYDRSRGMMKIPMGSRVTEPFTA